MQNHVCARCGEYSLLFPAENVAFIEPVAVETRFFAWRHRDRGAKGAPVLDLRRLLGVRTPAPPEEGVTLRWRATDGARELLLLVDAVEEIVNCHAGDLIEATFLPRRLRPLCSQVMRDPRGGLRLRVKPDALLPLDRPSDLRSFARALLARRVAGADGPRGERAP